MNLVQFGLLLAVQVSEVRNTVEIGLSRDRRHLPFRDPPVSKHTKVFKLNCHKIIVLHALLFIVIEFKIIRRKVEIAKEDWSE